MYADHTTIYFNPEKFQGNNLETAINKELDKVNVWLKLNKLTIHVEKTKCMFFRKNALAKTYPYIWTTKALMLFLILILWGYSLMKICHGKNT